MCRPKIAQTTVLKIAVLKNGDKLQYLKWYMWCFKTVTGYPFRERSDSIIIALTLMFAMIPCMCGALTVYICMPDLLAGLHLHISTRVGEGRGAFIYYFIWICLFCLFFYTFKKNSFNVIAINTPCGNSEQWQVLFMERPGAFKATDQTDLFDQQLS